MKKQYIYMTFLVVIISTTVVYIFLFLNSSGQSDNLNRKVNQTIGITSLSAVSESLSTDDVIFSTSTGHRLRSHHKNQSHFSYQVFSLKTTLKKIFALDLPDWISHASILPIYLLTNSLII